LHNITNPVTITAVNAQLPIALHILGFLASRGGESLTSDVMAATYGTSPVVLRRVLSKLQRAGLVSTQRGAGGGSVLARAPSEINLREAYEAVMEEPSLLRRHPGGCAGVVAPALAEFTNALFGEVEQSLLERLEGVTVEQMDREVRARIQDQMMAARERDGGKVGEQVLRDG